MICKASGLLLVMISTVAPSDTGAVTSTSSPLILPARAALARLVPIDAATSRTVAPSSRVFFDPSGRMISTIVSFQAYLIFVVQYGHTLHAGSSA